MDKIVDKIVALGVPGLILLVAISATGYAGAVALTAALAVLGGPFGMLGGIATLGVIALISKGIATYGFERIFRASVNNFRKKGMSVQEIKGKVEKYPISREMKLKVMWHLDQTV